MSASVRSPHISSLFVGGRTTRYDKGATITSTADDPNAVMMVAQGYVKRYAIKNDGSIGIQIIYGQHDVFPLTKLYRSLLGFDLYSGRETYYYTALSAAVIYSLSVDKIKQAIDASPTLYQELFYEAGSHLRTCVHRIESVSVKSSYRRVAHELYFMALEYGKAGIDGAIEFSLHVTHQEIADVLGLTRPTVTLAMVRLRDDGIIEEGRTISVKDVARLGDVAYL